MNLIERIEGAEGPSRELDAEIAKAFGIGAHYAAGNPSFAFSASLDAAMSLVPVGWFTSDYHQGPSGGNWWNLSRIRTDEQKYKAVMGSGKTPALALVATAIRAIRDTHDD